MFAYIIKKLTMLVLLLLGITFITFSIVKLLPGDPASGLIGQHADPDDIKRINSALGVDKPFISQFMGYVALLARGELGRSYYTNRDVLTEIMRKLPNTIYLAAAAMAIAIIGGLALGFAAGLRQGSAVDKICSALSLTGLSLPVFWSGLVLIIIFSLKLRLLPPSGTGGIRFVILPAIALSLPVMASIARITRSSAIETLAMPFIRVLRAKGLKNWRINYIHLLKSILIPLITVVGLDFASFLNGAVLTETVFGWDGIGRFTVDGILKRDYPVILGCIITGTFIFVVVNALVDVSYQIVDPRVRIVKR
ncbi:ABC transporter permease [Candidatus Magnetominusculus dajiuhuensis]|uniref:ABC transporter permease n=1 Tax=Candidatus Magnetominusculus dajiuhuensis TaxID=3137712 RepID=UPI003B43AE17